MDIGTYINSVNTMETEEQYHELRRVYSDGRRKYLVISTELNNGGALICVISPRRKAMKQVRFWRVPYFCIEGQQHPDEEALGKPGIRKTETFLPVTEASAILDLGIRKHIKTRNNWHSDYYKCETRILATIALDNLASGLRDASLMKSYMVHHDLPLTRDAYRKMDAANTIQRAWRYANTNPTYALCRKRLLHEFMELESHI